MSWMRVVANIVVQGTAVFGKAFMQAYANAASQAGKTAAEGAQAVIKRGQMTREEAIEILGVTADMLKHAPDDLQEKYEKFFHANDPKNGGSFYLQSKIFRAKEFLDQEAMEAAAAAASEEVDSGSGSGSGNNSMEEGGIGNESVHEEEPAASTEGDAAARKKRRSRRRERRNQNSAE
jgi:import inner membrane translocase subunit TIM16